MVRDELSCRGNNECISELLDISSEENRSFEKLAKLVKSKQRKSKKQINVLTEEFAKEPNWSYEFMKDLAVKLGISYTKVYKWHWDKISHNGKRLKGR
mmetsp:Transcript_19880/g.23042  ORF Transcript_19880/g.23042 Transcript_19880/m.23042 type:complete len:98 (-) Transcript_19880:76-369(-)